MVYESYIRRSSTRHVYSTKVFLRPVELLLGVLTKIGLLPWSHKTLLQKSLNGCWVLYRKVFNKTKTSDFVKALWGLFAAHFTFNILNIIKTIL